MHDQWPVQRDGLHLQGHRLQCQRKWSSFSCFNGADAKCTCWNAQCAAPRFCDSCNWTSHGFVVDSGVQWRQGNYRLHRHGLWPNWCGRWIVHHRWIAVLRGVRPAKRHGLHLLGVRYERQWSRTIITFNGDYCPTDAANCTNVSDDECWRWSSRCFLERP